MPSKIGNDAAASLSIIGIWEFYCTDWSGKDIHGIAKPTLHHSIMGKALSEILQPLSKQGIMRRILTAMLRA